MLRTLMFNRTRVFALALLLLLTQQFGVLHSLSHVRPLPAGRAVATALPALGSLAAKAAIDPVGSESPGDGLCQICLLLVALGAAALPALLQWLAARQRCPRRVRPALPALQSRRSAPYLARAPPPGPSLT